MNVTLLDIVRAARARLVPFPAESAAYLTLSACEQLAHAPRRSSLASIALEADGSVRVDGSEALDELDAERELREIFARMVEVASSPGPALGRAAARAPAGKVSALSAELEKALIPFNRSAARRALMRVHRETERVLESGRLGPQPNEVPVVQFQVSAPQPRAMEVVPPTPAPPPESAAEPRNHWVQIEPATRPETRLARLRVGQVTAAEPLPPWVETELTLKPAVRHLPPLRQATGRELPDAANHSGPPSSHSANESGSQFDSAELTERAPPVLDDFPYDSPDESMAVAEPCSQAVTPDMTALVVELVENSVELDDEIDAAPTCVPAYTGAPATRSHVEQLLDGFEVASPLAEGELRRELKALAGLDLTPGPNTQLRSRERAR